jgi:ABC-type phosphate transport system permease subunit
MEDFATNRLATIIMALLLLPLALRSTRERMRDVRARNQEASAPREMRT